MPRPTVPDVAPAVADSPNRGLLVAYLVGQLAFGLIAMTICIPSMQEWGALLDGDQARVQLTFSGYVLAYGGLQLLYGPLSDRLGRRKMLLTGLAVAGVGSAAAALAPDLATLTVARIIQGAGAAGGMVVGRAMVQDLFRGPDRTRVMAYIGMAMGLCPPLATIVGGQIHVQFGWRANFILLVLMCLALLLTGWRYLPRQAAPPPPGPHLLSTLFAAYTRLAREPAFLLHVTILAMATATFYAFLAGAPIVLGSYGIGPAGIGYYIMCIPGSYIAGNYLASRLARRSSAQSMMLVGQCLTMGGLALMLGLALAGLDTALALALPLVVLGFGHGILVPPALTGTVGLVPALAGSAAAVAGLMQQLMGAASGYAVGLLQHNGAVNLGWLMIGFAACGALAQAFLHRRRA